MDYPEFSEDNKSLLKKYLTRELFGRLEKVRTNSGFTFADAIRSGVANQDSSIGIYAGNAESYKVFADIFNPIISDYHSFNIDGFHRSDLSLPCDIENPDPDHRYIISTRIRVARNVAGFDFPSSINSESRKMLELKVVQAIDMLKSYNKNLQGRYVTLSDALRSERFSFIKKHFIFDGQDRFQASAGITRDWPESRGVFLSNDEKFIVWVNEEDHLRIIYMEKGGEIAKVFNNVSLALAGLEQEIIFAYNPHLGYLTSCPSNLGTGMRAGVHIRLPGLYKRKTLLFKIADSFNLQVRGTSGENTKVDNFVFDISNRQRLGITEKECVQDLHKGLVEIIEAEKTIRDCAIFS